MQDKVLGGVAKGKVVGGQLGLLCIEGALVTSQPTLVAQHSGGIDQGALQVNVDIRIGLDVLMAIGNLELATLVARLWGKVALQRQLKSLEQLILHSDLGEQGVVCVPLLSQSQAIVLDLVLGLQRTENLARLLVRVTGCVEFNARRCLGLQVQLPQAKVVAFAEDVTSLFAQIAV